MPVVVDPDSETLAELLKAIPTGGHGVDLPDRLQAWLVNRPEEYAVVLGPHVDLHHALAISDGMRLTRPSTSVVLVRDVVDTTRAPRGDGLRHPRRRPGRRPGRDHLRRGPRLPALHRASRSRRGDPHRPDRDRLLAQGRGRQDHDGGQPRARPGRQGRTQGLPGRLRPRLRRRRDHAPAVPQPHRRARHRLRGLHRRPVAGVADDPAPRLADGARRAQPPRRPRPGHARPGLPDPARPARDLRLHRRRHRARPSTSRR